ncbi:hypothetical protein D9613_005350 [Agrocybe pediades]|uniref:BRCT domain-containing protein n=1 Tax=Agrocybe pediades TaxID=84607 RepID=A0A8H4R0B1_9AGAR|nr:hypothetical protein D9613_005350 [Agrocybe pediades]
MEKYFPVVAKARPKVKTNGRIQTTALSVTEKREVCDEDSISHGCLPTLPPFNGGNDLSSSKITEGLLKNLSDPSNPITHSDIYKRTDHIVSCATGHQRSEGRADRSSYMAERTHKLRAQRDDSKGSSSNGKDVLKDVYVYIDGYLESTTDIEMKRLVAQAGGQVV